jgi:hypothetical protein
MQIKLQMSRSQARRRLNKEQKEALLSVIEQKEHQELQETQELNRRRTASEAARVRSEYLSKPLYKRVFEGLRALTINAVKAFVEGRSKSRALTYSHQEVDLPNSNLSEFDALREFYGKREKSEKDQIEFEKADLIEFIKKKESENKIKIERYFDGLEENEDKIELDDFVKKQQTKFDTELEHFIQGQRERRDATVLQRKEGGKNPRKQTNNMRRTKKSCTRSQLQ